MRLRPAFIEMAGFYLQYFTDSNLEIKVTVQLIKGGRLINRSILQVRLFFFSRLDKD